jgi:hypothetical protein
MSQSYAGGLAGTVTIEEKIDQYSSGTVLPEYPACCVYAETKLTL